MVTEFCISIQSFALSVLQYQPLRCSSREWRVRRAKSTYYDPSPPQFYFQNTNPAPVVSYRIRHHLAGCMDRGARQRQRSSIRRLQLSTCVLVPHRIPAVGADRHQCVVLRMKHDIVHLKCYAYSSSVTQKPHISHFQLRPILVM